MDEDFDDSAVKMAINNLLWTYLPKETTLGRADAIAMQMFYIVEKEAKLKPTDQGGAV